MLNKNYGLELAKKLGNSVERVKNDDLEVLIATKNPKYVETSEDRPNFYSPWLFKKAYEADNSLDIATYIDKQIERYEQVDLSLGKIDKNAVVSCYLVDNISLVLTVRPYELVKQLGIDIKDLYNLNYLKCIVKETNEVKYFWINDFLNNEDRKESLTLLCSIDNWMTYYKDIVPRMKGDVKVLRKHFDRYVERDNRLVGNYSLNSPVNNIDSGFENMNNNIVRSLGLDVEQINDLDNGIIDTQVLDIDDNKIIFEFDYTVNYWDNTNKTMKSYTKNWNYDNITITNNYGNHTVYQTSKGVITSSNYDINGNFKSNLGYYSEVDKRPYRNIKVNQDKLVIDEMYNPSTSGFYYDLKDQTRLIENSFKEFNNRFRKPVCYGPKKFNLLAFQLSKYKYVYTRKYDAGHSDSYGVILSNNSLETDGQVGKYLINRIANVRNANLLTKGIKTTGREDWRWAVLKENGKEFENVRNSKLDKTASGLFNKKPIIATYNNTGCPNTNLALYLVDYNTRTGYGEYSTKYKINGAQVKANFTTFFEQLPDDMFKITPNIPSAFKWSNLNNKSITSVIADNAGAGFKDFQVFYYPTIIMVDFNGYIDNEYLYSTSIDNDNGVCSWKFNYNIVANQLDPNKTKDTPIEIDALTWNSNGTNELFMTNEIINQDYDNIMEPLTMRFKPIEYIKDADWEWDREPQVKMGHCIKHFVDYLGVRKQLFTEFGNIDKIYLNQTILPQGVIDKIYYTDITKDYNMWELVNTNGFLTKQYDNSIPSLTDVFTQFIAQNQAQLQNSYLTATTNLDFAKKQAALNNKLAKFGIADQIQSGLFSGATAVALGGRFTSRTDILTHKANYKINKAAGSPSGVVRGFKQQYQDAIFDNISTGTGVAKGAVGAIFGGVRAGLAMEQTKLNNEKMIFNAQQQVRGLEAMVKDKYNQPDQLNQGSVEVNAIIRYQKELGELFETYGINTSKAICKIDTLAPSKIELENYSMFINKNGYIANKVMFKQDFESLMSRTRFNFIQLADVENMIFELPTSVLAKNYFMNMFNSGVRLWNLDYENQKMCDYSKENWEISLENK